MPKSQKRLLAIGGTVGILAASAGVAWAMNQPPAEIVAPAPSVSATATPTPTKIPTVEPTPTPTATTPPAAPVDTAKPEEVVKAWAQAYFTRTTGSDTSYQVAIEPLITPALREFMRTDEYNIDGKGYLDQSEGTRVLDVKITPQDGSVGIDTPVRWTRAVTVSVEGLSTGTKHEIPYILELRLTEPNWVIVGAPKAVRMVD